MCNHSKFVPFRFVPLIVAGLSCSFLVSTHALPDANAQKPAATELHFQLRTYEVGDLVLNIQDHPYSEAPQGGASVRPVGGGGVFSVPDGLSHSEFLEHGIQLAVARPAKAVLRFTQFGGGGGVARANDSPNPARITMDDLIDVLVSTVAFDSWRENGTGEGEVQPLGTALVVSQTQEVHKQIENLLEQLRQGSADRKTLTIDARWLLLDSDELDALVLANQSGVPQVNREVLGEFTRRPDSIRGITNCFSTQLVYLVSGTRRNVVSSYIPVVGSVELPRRNERYASRQHGVRLKFVSDTQASDAQAPKVGYQPIVEKPNLGALLEIRPTLIPTESEVVVDVKSTITVTGEQPKQSDSKPKSASLAPQVDRIAIETQEFATTLRMPLGKPILVGGLTHVPASSVGPQKGGGETKGQKDGLPAEKRQLYFVLEVRQ